MSTQVVNEPLIRRSIVAVSLTLKDKQWFRVNKYRSTTIPLKTPSTAEFELDFVVLLSMVSLPAQGRFRDH